MPLLDEDRLFPPDSEIRALARGLYEAVRDLPIVSPHGHTDPAWFALDEAFADPSALFVTPDHYVFRMLHSQGIPLNALGVPRRDGGAVESDPRAVWRLFAQNYHLFRGTPSRLWIDHAFQHVFGVTERLSADTADAIYDQIAGSLAQPEFRPRALYDRFGIEVIATTESPLDDLAHHRTIADSDWQGRVITAYRPDAVVDPDFEGFAENVERFGALAGEDATTWQGYLAAHRNRRAYFKTVGGATSTDHGHPTARTEDLPQTEAAALFVRALQGKCTPDEADRFRGHMLTEMARMSLDDGLVMQLHPGSVRNHSGAVFDAYGRDKGYDIPTRVDYVTALRPLLNAVGETDMTLIMFTLDESSYARELAPLAGVYPALKLGPAWWFHDSAEGMRRFREMTTETAGFYNTVGFNDDTRALCSIPARHDVARRVDCAYLAGLVATGRLAEDEAPEVAHDLAYRLAKEAYKL
ncbi:glucuronate isomerase [Litoreibacter ponti]|uniref:Uronate isomerase n=1 Tax=Litoreibacter ponti TaxID=1510457 RepID=A0A2T6BMS6_9RHOB|nr:glucuronate isomerase [Litoreibacter ponti]PTX57383.1 glucuronate isomerase [Litoreibacter ponti]